MADSMVVDEEQAVIDNVGPDLMGEIEATVGPSGKDRPTPEKPEAPEPETAEEAAAPPVEKPVEEKELPTLPEGLSPADVRDSALPTSPEDLGEGALPDADIQKTFGKDEKAKQAFIKERARTRELAQKLRAFETDAGQLPELKDSLKQAQERANRLESEMGMLDLSRSPAFRKQYDDKIQGVGQKMVRVLMEDGSNQDEAVDLVKSLLSEKRPSDRERLASDYAPSLVGTLVAMAMEADEVSVARHAALENWKQSKAALEETQLREQTAQFSEKAQEFAREAVAQASQLGNPYFTIVENDAEWNSQVEERVKTVQGIMLSGDLSKIAPYIAEGITAADLRSRYSILLSEKKELQAQLDAVLKGSPRLGNGSTVQRTAPQAARLEDLGSGPIEDSIASFISPG